MLKVVLMVLGAVTVVGLIAYFAYKQYYKKPETLFIPFPKQF